MTPSAKQHSQQSQYILATGALRGNAGFCLRGSTSLISNTMFADFDEEACSSTAALLRFRPRVFFSAVALSLAARFDRASSSS